MASRPLCQFRAVGVSSTAFLSAAIICYCTVDEKVSVNLPITGLEEYTQLLAAGQNDIGNFLVSLIPALPAG